MGLELYLTQVMVILQSYSISLIQSKLGNTISIIQSEGVSLSYRGQEKALASQEVGKAGNLT